MHQVKLLFDVFFFLTLPHSKVSEWKELKIVHRSILRGFEDAYPSSRFILYKKCFTLLYIPPSHHSGLNVALPPISNPFYQ